MNGLRSWHSMFHMSSWRNWNNLCYEHSSCPFPSSETDVAVHPVFGDRHLDNNPSWLHIHHLMVLVWHSSSISVSQPQVNSGNRKETKGLWDHLNSPDRSSLSMHSSSFIHYMFRSRHAHPSHRSHCPTLSTFKVGMSRRLVWQCQSQGQGQPQ